MEGVQRRDWITAYMDGSPGVPPGYAVEFGTGRLVPLVVAKEPRSRGRRPLRKGG